MNEVLMFGTILLPVVTAVVELIKKTFNIRKNIVPSVSFFLGILIGILAYPIGDLDLASRAWAGAIAGLAGTGLFELAHKREGYTKEK